MLSPGAGGSTQEERIEQGERTVHDQALRSGQGREAGTHPQREWPRK